MDFEQWCRLDEQIYVAESDERYKQFAGLNFSSRIIEKLAYIRSTNAELFLTNFSKPHELYLSALENIAESRTKSMELKFYKLRNQQIISKHVKFRGSPVNWSSWRQFNSQEKNSKSRKLVFDTFVDRSRLLAPHIHRRFSKIAEIYRQYSHGKVSPLKGYLEDEKISKSNLVDFVKKLGNKARKPFREKLASISRQLLGRDAEYFDDFYFFRSRVFGEFEAPFASIDPVLRAKQTLRRIGFDTTKISFDAVQRADKYPSPICFFVQIPNDVRVLFKSESPYFDFQGCFHETGHAVHATSISESASYPERYGFAMGVAEIFSIFFERLTKNKLFLKSLGINDNKTLDGLRERSEFLELYFLNFYVANSLMKLEYWQKELSVDKATTLYAKHLLHYVGLPIPGEYWMLHHILPEAIMYVPSYLLAAVRAAELESVIEERFGENWWLDSSAGRFLQNIMKPGAGINLSEFSRLEARIYLKELGL